MQNQQENLPPAVMARVAREIKTLMTKELEGIRIEINEQDMTDIQAIIDGPSMFSSIAHDAARSRASFKNTAHNRPTEDTPYEGGQFRLRLVLGSDFPEAPPKGYFITKIFHPNVSKDGEICVNTLKRDWSSSLDLTHVLLVCLGVLSDWCRGSLATGRLRFQTFAQTIKCLLIVPNAESALNEEAGRQLLEAYDDYAKYARLMTSIHATPKDTQQSSASGVQRARGFVDILGIPKK